MNDSRIHLKIITGLSLEVPSSQEDLQRRFLEPYVAREYAGYPELDYIRALRSGSLPANVEIAEFFLNPGRFLDISPAQQNFISSNYTSAVRDLMDNGVNLLVQMVSKRSVDDCVSFSLSSNPDVTLDLAPMLRAAVWNGKAVAVVGQVNNCLPFMGRDAAIEPQFFDFVIDNPALEFAPYAVPNPRIDVAGHLIGFYASTLIQDGGTLEVGFGSLSDAVCNALRMRHEHAEVYRRVLTELRCFENYAGLINRTGGTQPFLEGLYAASEMFSNGLLQLLLRGIIRRKVYDDLTLQELLNQGRIEERIGIDTLRRLLDEKVIRPRLTPQNFAFLQKFGIFRDDVDYRKGYIHAPAHGRIEADLTAASNLEKIAAWVLGEELKQGTAIHAAFFLGPREFYETLRAMDERLLDSICMTRVSNVNRYRVNEELIIAQRRHARFVNTAMKVSLDGAVVSDALEDGRIVSGVGGQHDFVVMAQGLPGARSILILRSTHRRNGKLESNIVWRYGHCTIPGHLRDIVITEYGIADIRGKAAKEVAAALLNIADSRFQSELLDRAKRAGNLPANYQIPEPFRDNRPERLDSIATSRHAQDVFPDYPFGSALTSEEILLSTAMRSLEDRTATIPGLIRTITAALKSDLRDKRLRPYLKRLDLEQPSGWREWLNANMISAEVEKLTSRSDQRPDRAHNQPD